MIRLLIAGYCAQRPGGVETFIRNLASGLSKEEFQVSVLAIDSPPNGVRESFEAMDVRFFHPQRHLILKKWEADVHNVVNAIGPIDIIHCNGVTNIWRWLKGARESGIPLRIFHGHNPIQKFGGFFRELYIRHHTIPLLSRYATHCVFCSQYVMDQWRRLGPNTEIPCVVKHCGIDFSAFKSARVPLRSSLGIPEDAIVFGQIGRFTRQKNHSFLIDIFKAIAAREPRAYFLLVGSGQREMQIQRRIAQAGLKDRVILTGRRPDIPDLLATMNVFVLPSFFEGLPLVSVEAQAAGVPSLCSTGISLETCLLPGMIKTLSLNDSAESWAAAAIAQAQEVFPPRAECLKVVRNSPFELTHATQTFAVFYRELLRTGNGTSAGTNAVR